MNAFSRAGHQIHRGPVLHAAPAIFVIIMVDVISVMSMIASIATFTIIMMASPRRLFGVMMISRPFDFHSSTPAG